MYKPQRSRWGLAAGERGCLQAGRSAFMSGFAGVQRGSQDREGTFSGGRQGWGGLLIPDWCQKAAGGR